MKYRKKPVVIEAVQFRPASSTQVGLIKYWMETGEYRESGIHTSDITTFEIETLEGPMRVSPNDYVIKGVQGEFYPCKPDIFKQTYEPVEEMSPEDPRNVAGVIG